jgi:chitinase
VGATGQDVVSFSDPGLAASTSYSYRVVATNASGDSAPSAVVSATTDPAAVVDTEPPTAPSKLKATAAKRKINLTWTGSTDIGSGVAGYKVYRSGTAEGPFTLVTTTTGMSASLDAPSGAVLWYRVTAYDVAGNESVPSPAVRAVAR